MADTEQYLSLFTHYYRDRDKFLAMARLLLKPFVDLQKIKDEYCNKLDVTTAKGIYLDLIGKILGYSRYLNFDPTSTTRTILTDEEYRKLLRARQFIGRWDGTTKGFEDLWKSSGITYSHVYGIDNSDMTVTYGVMGNTNPLEEEVMTRRGYFPHTAGVALTIHLIPMTIFGFMEYGDPDSSNTIRTGFATYEDSKEKEGMCLNYDNWKGVDLDEV